MSLLKVEGIPFSSQVLYKNKSDAKSCPTESLHILMCENCGLIFNSGYSSKSLSKNQYDHPDYFSSVTCSEHARNYQQLLAKQIHELWGLTNQIVCEIGCGDGFFLNELRRYCHTAIGFEPSPTYNLAKKYQKLIVFNDYFHPDLICQHIPKINMFVLRHVIEHLLDPFSYIKMFSRHYDSRKNGQALFLEVPDAAFLIMNNLYFDFYIDHIFYFTKDFLTNLLRVTGWRSVLLVDAKDNEFLRILSLDWHRSVLEKSLEPADSLLQVGSNYSQNYRSWKNQILEKLHKIKTGGRRIGVWGAGSRGVTLLTSLGIGNDFFTYVIDSDPNKQNRYIPLLGTPIVSMDVLESDPVDYLVVTAYTYLDEIIKFIRTKSRADIKIINPYEVSNVI